MTPQHEGMIKECICIYKSAFVGVMNENINVILVAFYNQWESEKGI